MSETTLERGILVACPKCFLAGPVAYRSRVPSAQYWCSACQITFGAPEVREIARLRAEHDVTLDAIEDALSLASSVLVEDPTGIRERAWAALGALRSGRDEAANELRRLRGLIVSADSDLSWARHRNRWSHEDERKFDATIGELRVTPQRIDALLARIQPTPTETNDGR